MTRTSMITAAALLLAGLPGSSWASQCSDDVAKLEQILSQEGASAVSAQSGGQKDAAERSSKAIEARKTDTQVAELPAPPDQENMAGTKAAAAASTAGESVMAAKVSINDAKNADKKGDALGCRRAYDAAKRALEH